MSIQEGFELNVVSANWVSGYVLEIFFSDDFSHEVDFGPFLEGSILPYVRKYVDVEQFKGFKISYGNLIWTDYDLCFSVEDLYSGDISVSGQSQRMVAEEEPEYRNGDSATD